MKGAKHLVEESDVAEFFAEMVAADSLGDGGGVGHGRDDVPSGRNPHPFMACEFVNAGEQFVHVHTLKVALCTQDARIRQIMSFHSLRFYLARPTIVVLEPTKLSNYNAQYACFWLVHANNYNICTLCNLRLLSTVINIKSQNLVKNT